MIDLWLFAHDAERVRAGRAAGIGTFVVDWEHRGKACRQVGVDTEINRDTPDDLRRLRDFDVAQRVCRIDRFGPWSRDEVRIARECGATTILVPMVESARTLEEVRRWVGNGVAVGVLIETAAGVERAAEIAAAAPDCVYVGLHDLSISRRRPLFEPLLDGTVEELREEAGATPFGFGGVTVVDGGAPLPFRCLLAEMARLGCRFSFARRSFRRDIAGRSWERELVRLADAWRDAERRSAVEVERDRRELVQRIRCLGSAR